ncbi:MAG: preprotein translocase subunit YajC [Propionicimonas sp.]|nr:preprotein translocase subunit YajC [Propionicimonas sp.]
MDWSTILMVVLMGAALYFLLLRPQQKRAKEQQAKLAALEAGSRVMTISGIVGTISHLGEKQAIIEIAPGVEITVDKRALSTQPIEDEFEYVDAEPDTAAEPEASEVVEEPQTFDPTPPAADAEDPRQH